MYTYLKMMASATADQTHSKSIWVQFKETEWKNVIISHKWQQLEHKIICQSDKTQTEEKIHAPELHISCLVFCILYIAKLLLEATSQGWLIKPLMKVKAFS